MGVGEAPAALQASRGRQRADCPVGRAEASTSNASGDIVLCMSQLNLSARAYHRILQLARAIADLAGCEEIGSVHLAEALHASQPSEADVQHHVMG